MDTIEKYVEAKETLFLCCYCCASMGRSNLIELWLLKIFRRQKNGE